MLSYALMLKTLKIIILLLLMLSAIAILGRFIPIGWDTLWGTTIWPAGTGANGMHSFFLLLP